MTLVNQISLPVSFALFYDHDAHFRSHDCQSIEDSFHVLLLAEHQFQLTVNTYIILSNLFSFI